MAFKLNKNEEERLDELKKELAEVYSEIESTVRDYNDEEAKLREPIDLAVNSYNEKLAILRSFTEDVAAERRSEFDDRSETWQNGDTGQTIDEWISTWENADLEDVIIKYPEEELEVDFESHSDTELPIEP